MVDETGLKDWVLGNIIAGGVPNGECRFSLDGDGANLTRRFRIDGAEYDVGTLPPEGQALLERMTFAQLRLQELANQQALLTKAKNAYIADLKLEIVQGRTGVDLVGLFGDN
jgi:hypothetical protein